MIPRTLWEYWWARGNGPAAPAPPAGTVPLVLEPTGFLRPEAVSRSMQQEEQAQTLLEADGQLGGARKWFHYTYGQRSKFYQTGQILFTDEYISGSGISGVDNSMPDHRRRGIRRAGARRPPAGAAVVRTCHQSGGAGVHTRQPARRTPDAAAGVARGDSNNNTRRPATRFTTAPG
jgi:hypothetical protein